MRVVIAVLLILGLSALLFFVAINSAERVPVNLFYLIPVQEYPVSLVALVSLVAGVLFASIIGIVEGARLRIQNHQLRNRIKERDKNFSLAREISEIQSELNFPSQTVNPGNPRTKFDSYIQVGTSIRYKDKSLDDIVKFLYAIEKPERGIIVENFRLEPSKNRKKFAFNINLYSVSLVDINK